jgi:hypothetical protein
MSETQFEDEVENAHKQYDRVLMLIQYYVQLTWLIFGAFLLAETVLFAAIAAAAKDGPRLFVFLAAALGLLLTLPWWSSFRYNHALYLLRVAEARKLEPLAGTFFTSGAELISGVTVQSTFGPISIPAFARELSPSRSVQFLIFLFAVSFASVAVAYWPWQCQ